MKMYKSYLNSQSKTLLSFLTIIWLFSPLLSLGLDESTKADWLILKALRENSLSEIDSQLSSEKKDIQDQRKLIAEKETRALAEDDKEQSHLNSHSNNIQLTYIQKPAEDSHGLSFGINTQLKSTSAKVMRSGFTFDGVGEQNIIANLTSDYEFRLIGNLSMLIGASIDLNNMELLDINGKDRNFKVTEKNHYSFFVAPAYQISSSTKGYMKLAYHHSKIETENNINGTSDNKNIQGYGLGLGLRSRIFDNLYANLEIERIMYNTDSLISTDLSTGSTVGTIGLIYNFSKNNSSAFLLEPYTNNFTGLSFGINSQFKSTIMKLSVPTEPAKADFKGIGEQNINGNIVADYEFQFTKNIAVIEGFSFDLGNTETLKISGNGEAIKIMEKNHYSFFIAPAYKISYNTLGYAKFAYHHSDFNTENSLSAKNINRYYEKGIDGFGFGFGLRSHLYKNVYINGEIQRIIYNSTSFSPVNIDTTSTVGDIGLSYKF